jgi:hypothetical protein
MDRRTWQIAHAPRRPLPAYAWQFRGPAFDLADLLGINRGRVVAHVLVSKTVKDLTAFLIVNRTSSVIGGHNPREDSGINGVPRCSETGPSTAWTECRSTRSTIGGFQAKADVSC